MQKFMDEETGIIIGHPDNWIGDVDISYPMGDSREQIRVSSTSLLRGEPIFTAAPHPSLPYPGDVMLRSVALCVDRFWRWKAIGSVEQIGLPR